MAHQDSQGSNASKKTGMKAIDRWRKIEDKWQKHWDENEIFRTLSSEEAKELNKEKFYCLTMFPYPSGQGLHVGHPLSYVASDIYCRYKRMKNFNVLFPMGWDAFGLPAEQYAIQNKVHPEETTAKNVSTYKNQLSSLGLSFDWSREINTTDPKYYKWTQWIFKKMHERGLAYQAEVDVNWCPALGTVLANDEVIDGKSERGGHPVERKPMRQWMMKITEYAERLLSDLDDIDWPESTKELQRNWIGKSTGANVTFGVKDHSAESMEIFTTRPDTLFGVTFMVLAPEHPLVEKITSEQQKAEVAKYVEEAKRKNDVQRTDLSKEKSGVFTGGYAIHPISGENVPVWVADYVLMNYGTGAIMAVPAHDERDEEFAQKFGINIVPVIDENNQLINSASSENDFNGLDANDAKKSITTFLEEKNLGKASVTYKLRDWIFSRQRYWGEPIPVIHTNEKDLDHGFEVLADNDLPLTLPKVESYEPTGTGESPLASVEVWVSTPEGRRETNTMPSSAGSSWYFLRYMDPHNDQAAWSQDSVNYWKNIDLYVGGSEHAVGHLLYSRFWHKVFFDMGLVPSKEPFQKLVHQGMMQGEDGEKMSKSRGNVVNPDDVIHEYGADTFRLFEMFLGPLEKSKPWQTQNIEGTYRFLSRYWRLCFEEDHCTLNSQIVDTPESEWPEKVRRSMHKMIFQVDRDINNLRFNTGISAMMIFLNDVYSAYPEGKNVPRKIVENLTLCLSPFAPHICEEIWESLGNTQSLSDHDWPSYDPKLTVEDEITLVIQINGKVRDRLTAAADVTEASLKEAVLQREHVQKHLAGKEIRKFIYVKGKLVSIVV